jgi:hypothetical protein
MSLRYTIEHPQDWLDDSSNVNAAQRERERLLFNRLRIRQGSDERRRSPRRCFDTQQETSDIHFRQCGMFPGELNRALNRRQGSGEIVRDSSDKPVELLSRETLSVSGAYGTFFGTTQSIDEPADDDRDPKEQPEIHRVTQTGDGRSANRISQQHIVPHTAGNSRDDGRAAPGCHREAHHQHNHEVLIDEGR